MPPSSSAYILVVAPPSLTHALKGEDGADTPLRVVAGVGEMLKCLESEQVAAVVCYEATPADREASDELAAWYERRGRSAPLLAVVTDLSAGKEGRRLHGHASLLFSRYHSRPREIIALLRQWAFPQKKKK